MSTATDQGRAAVRPLLKALVAGAAASGDPREYWNGAFGFLSGAAGASLGLHETKELMTAITQVIQHAIDTNALPTERV